MLQKFHYGIVCTNAVSNDMLSCESHELLLLTWMDCSQAACQAFISVGGLKHIVSTVCQTLTGEFGSVSVIPIMNTRH